MTPTKEILKYLTPVERNNLSALLISLNKWSICEILKILRDLYIRSTINLQLCELKDKELNTEMVNNKSLRRFEKVLSQLQFMNTDYILEVIEQMSDE